MPCGERNTPWPHQRAAGRRRAGARVMDDALHADRRHRPCRRPPPRHRPTRPCRWHKACGPPCPAPDRSRAAPNRPCSPGVCVEIARGDPQQLALGVVGDPRKAPRAFEIERAATPPRRASHRARGRPRWSHKDRRSSDRARRFRPVAPRPGSSRAAARLDLLRGTMRERNAANRRDRYRDSRQAGLRRPRAEGIAAPGELAAPRCRRPVGIARLDQRIDQPQDGPKRCREIQREPRQLLDRTRAARSMRPPHAIRALPRKQERQRAGRSGRKAAHRHSMPHRDGNRHRATGGGGGEGGGGGGGGGRGERGKGDRFDACHCCIATLDAPQSRFPPARGFR